MEKGNANQYDKIIKENLEVTLPVIIKDMLGLEVVGSEDLPDDVQHTKERKPDALKKITDSRGEVYVLHLEFQVADDSEMVYRMAEYHIMLGRKYKLPVRQYVIYLKSDEPKMSTMLESGNLRFSYHLVCISKASYQLFLRSKNPAVKMLGILADLGNSNRLDVIKAIVNEVNASADSELLKSKYLKQLRIFVQLRNHIEEQIEEAMESVSTFFKEEKDIFYRRGEAKGAEKKTSTIVANLILESNMTDEKIAKIAEVRVDFVKQVREEISGK